MEKPSIIPQIYTESCPSSPTIPFKQNQTPNIPKRIRKIYENHQLLKKPQREGNNSKLKKNPQVGYQLPKEELKKEEIEKERRSEQIRQKIPELYRNNIRSRKIGISEFHHSNTKEEVRRNTKPELSSENFREKNKIKSKPDILKKYEYTLNVQEEEEDKNEGESLLPTPIFGSIKKKEKMEIKIK